jgi:amidohydrolase
MTIEQQVIEWRQHIHQHPEFGFEEVQTSKMVADKLEEFGIEVHRNIGKTGVVGVLKCGNSDRSIGLRADMDALHVTEQNVFKHASTYEGVMHACGHDGHTSMLLGAAHELARTRDFDGTVYFIFQPGEEHGLGAKAMIADGLFSRWNIDAIYAMHNLPGIPEGHFVTRPGSIMASESSFEIDIIATGGHAAMPHMSTDPIVVGAQVVTAMQTIVSRNLSAIHETAVISITEFTTNGTVNVIPSKVNIKGDTRSFTDEALAKIDAAIERIVKGQCISAGVDYKYRFNNSFLSTINSHNIQPMRLERRKALLVKTKSMPVASPSPSVRISPLCCVKSMAATSW